ncbi:MAG: hypothetical protein AAFZ05_07340 [Pseudomonadota bacterium]
MNTWTDPTLTPMTTWHPNDDATPTPEEVEGMATMLEGRHGLFAADVADFFSTFHGQRGDAGRSWAWQGVAERVRYRTRCRTTGRKERHRARLGGPLC